LQRVNDKQVRTDSPAASSPRPVAQIKKPSNLPNAAGTPVSRATATPTTPKINSQMPSANIGPRSSVATELAKPLKKGSYAEILARAKAAQSGAHAQIGKIQHKPIEKRLSKKERKEQEAQGLQGRRGPKKASLPAAKTDSKDGRNGVRQNGGKVSKKADLAPEKKIKKAALATTGYKGTARPIPMLVRGKIPSSASRPNGKDEAGQSRRSIYATEEDEEDEDEDEEEEDYYSDESSDMEAAVYEVDEEEERATRIARKEDEEAAREETRLKCEKEEKRRRLIAMARGRR
jgi:protein SPT2